MLRIIPQANSAAAKSYYAEGHSDYYVAGMESPAKWGGRGAAMLGLSGAVQKQQFDQLCDNLDPRSGKRLTGRTRSDRTVLYDFNLHVPKSLSVLIEQSGDTRLLEAVQVAADAMMHEAEAEMQSRVRKENQDTNRLTGNMVYTSILHRTSRPSKDDGRPDPLTHLHITVFNATFDGVENQWKAGQFRDLVRDAPYWQAVFHSKLTEELNELGYGIRRTKNAWEVAGVPQSINDKFSRRTAEIEALAKELDITDPVAKSKLGATSREKKTQEPIENLRAYWDSRLTPAERQALKDVVTDANSGEFVSLKPSVEAAVKHAISHSFSRASVVPEKRLVAEALNFGVGGVTPAAVRAELNKQGVMNRVWDGRLVSTTPEVLKEEERMLAFARQGRGRCKPIKPKHQIRDARLNEDQRAAVEHLLTSIDRVMIVRGVAGAGKTTLSQEAVAAIRSTGLPVLTIAQSADASRGTLRNEGFDDADTVTKFLTNQDYREQARGGVIWVDEAGLLGAPTMAKLFDAAKELQARVVLIGDSKQHAAVERGAVLRILETHAGVPVTQVKHILRQKGPYKQAVELLAEGQTVSGVEALDKLGWIQELPDGEREQAIAQEYAEAKAVGEKVLVVSPTHAEGDRVTAAIREQLKDRKVLSAERAVMQLTPANLTEAQRADSVNYVPGDVLQFMRHAPGHKAGSRLPVGNDPSKLPLNSAEKFQAFHTGTIPLAVGDTVRITANGWTKNGKHRLDNGSLHTVAGFTKQGDIRFTNGWTIAQDFGHLTHGYVSTSHGSQGRTVDRVILAQSSASFPASSREQFYVSVSRGRQKASIYTDNKEALRDAVSRSDPRIAAVELFGTLPASQRMVRQQPTRSRSEFRLRDWVAQWQRRAAMQRHHEPVPTREQVQHRGYGR